MKLTEEECEGITNKIDSEGFDYYFTCYGADPELERFVADEITTYIEAKKALVVALNKIGVDTNL